jgi:hypothetical protein
MGERMGALGKMEDAQRDTLQRLQAETTRCASALQDNAADMRAAEVELTHQKETAARLLELVDKHAALIEKLNGTSADVKKELAFRALQQQQTDAANVAERKTLLRSIDECQTKVNSTVQQQAVLEQERKRLTDDVKQLQKLLAATRTELTDSLQQVQLDLQSNNGAHKALKSELASARTTLAELASRQQSDANAVEARFAAQLAQQQRQLSALQADIRTVAATSGAPVGGFYSLLLALAMPFVSPERLVGLVASVGRGFQAIASKRPLRHLWAFALLVDVAMRAGEYRGMLGQRSVPQLWLAPLFSTARGKQALRSARVMRLIFEVVTAIQVVMMVHEASLNAGRRATAALRKSIGRLRSSSPEQTSSDDNNNSSSSGESSNVETPSGGARTTFVKAAVARVFGNRFD